MLKRDPQARVYIKNLAQQVVASTVQNAHPKLDEKAIEEKVKRLIEAQKSNETPQKKPVSRFDELFLKKGVSHG